MTRSRTAAATVLGAIVLGLTWLGTTAPRALSAAAVSHGLAPLPPELAECPTQIGKFRQADVWYRGRNRLLLEAESACGSPYGDTMDLKSVRLSIVSGDRTYAVLRSPIGTYDRAGHQLLLGPTQKETDEGCLRGVPALLVNLRSGELRAPGVKLALGSPAELPACSGRNAP